MNLKDLMNLGVDAGALYCLSADMAKLYEEMNELEEKMGDLHFKIHDLLKEIPYNPHDEKRIDMLNNTTLVVTANSMFIELNGGVDV